MKIAVALPNCSTGGAKYIYLLLKSIIKLRPDCEISIWHDIKDDYPKELIMKELMPLGVTFKNINLSIDNPKGIKKIIIKFLAKIGIRIKTGHGLNWSSNPKMFNQYDILFCPWPYNFHCPNVDIPIVCVPHDFNYTHHFGLNIYSHSQSLQLKMQHQNWFKKATPIVSTNFMARELKKNFPEFKKDVDVAHLSAFNDFEKMEEHKVDKILTDLGINFDYVLSANCVCYHKNFNILYSGYYYLKQKYPEYKLLISGHATAGCKGESNSPYYIDKFSKNSDVIGLGLVSDEVFLALMQRAKVVINASLYEGGSGSSLDAWRLGAPVVMSDIETFKEHIDVLGVKAQIFDPQCGKDLAEAMFRVLDNPEQTKKDVEISQKAIKNYGWDKVAQKYISVFERIMTEAKK